MELTTLSTCLALIKGSFRMAGREWDTEVQAMYSLFLEPLDGELCQQALRAHILANKWPPAVSEIIEKVGELASPTPDAEEAWTELSDLIDRYSVNGIPHEYETPDGRKRLVHLRGAPGFSHPLISQALNELCGGYIPFCEGAVSRLPGGHVRQFKETYTRLRSKWCQSVADAISGGSRPQNLFPSYVPYQRPAQRQLRAITDGSAGGRRDDGEKVPMPDHVAERLNKVFERKLIGSKLDLEA